MLVKMLSHTECPERTVALASKLCYMGADKDPLTAFNNMTDESIEKQISLLDDLGHESPIEHSQFTFYIQDVSRVLLAQISRHRIASFSVQSQRYVRFIINDDTDVDVLFVTPNGIAAYPEAEFIYKTQCIEAINKYNELADILSKNRFDELYNVCTEAQRNDEAYIAKIRNIAEKFAIENARYVLPQSMCTRLIITMNARSLRNFFKLRCCNRAQDEIRELATRMYVWCYAAAPNLFANAGPSCAVTGRCSEGRMTCGNMQSVVEKFKTYRNLCDKALCSCFNETGDIPENIFQPDYTTLIDGDGIE